MTDKQRETAHRTRQREGGRGKGSGLTEERPINKGTRILTIQTAGLFDVGH